MKHVIKIILRDRYYIPAEAASMSALKNLVEIPLITKAACRPSCPLSNKAGRYCSTCPSRDAKVKMWEKIITKAGRELIAIPCGDDYLLKQVVNKPFKIIDKRADSKMKSALRWTGKLRSGGFNSRGEREADQVTMVKSWLKQVKGGVTGGTICSPARSGKCVVSNTIIQTSNGYECISNLFKSNLEDVVGYFGVVSTPSATAQIRGLHRRIADEVIFITLENGIRLGGTPEHPVAIYKNNPYWIKLEQIKLGTNILLPPAIDPVPNNQGLTVDEAALMGHIVAYTDVLGIQDNLVDLDEAEIDYDEADLLQALLYKILGINLKHNCKFNLNSNARLKHWQSLLLQSTHEAWRAFIGALTLTNFSSTPSFLLPKQIAEATLYHLVGCGVIASIHQEICPVVVIHDREGLKTYLKGERPNGLELGITSQVIRIERILNKVEVYDLMVPETHSFITNGIASHNTVIGVRAALATHSRTFITGSQSRFIKQFGICFGKVTNLYDIASDKNHPVVMIDPKGWKDASKYGVHVVKKWGPEVDKADVVMSAYQQLLDTENGRERIKKYIDGKFGLMIIDEAHTAAAPCFSKLTNHINVRRRLGLTATIVRRDGLSPVMSAVIGKTASIGRITSTLPHLELMETGVSSARVYKFWPAMESFLAKHEERNKIIVRQVFKDLRENKLNSILIPVTRVQQNLQLVRMINDQAAYCNKNKGEHWPVDLALSYRGGQDIDEVLNQVNAGRVRVVIATNSMVKFGIDIQRWSHVYIGVIPTSNAANVYQALNRVCTPYTEELENKIGPKPQPTVRFIIDQMSASVYCFAKLWNNSDYGIKGMLSGKNYYGVVLAKADKSVIERMNEIATYPKSYSSTDVGVSLVGSKSKTGRSIKRSAWTPRLQGITKL